MVLDKAENYQVKWLDVNPGHRLSLQSHECRSEHWTVVAGTATVTRDDEIIEVPQGGDVYIPRRAKHRVENRGGETLRIIEVQTGAYLGEGDIVRYEDDYGRG
jgi:mannose-6-phosphate isomerase-like protein (cupin superfamily)